MMELIPAGECIIYWAAGECWVMFHLDSWSDPPRPPRVHSDWRRHRPGRDWYRCESRTGKPQSSRSSVSSWKLWWRGWSRCSQCPSCRSDIWASQSWSWWWWTRCCPPSWAGSHRRCGPASNFYLSISLFSLQTWFIIWNFERVEDNALGLRLAMCRS